MDLWDFNPGIQNSLGLIPHIPEISTHANFENLSTIPGPALSQGVAIQQGAVAVQGAQPVAYAQPAAYAGIAAQPAAFGYSGLGAPFAGQAIGYGGFAGFAAAPQLAFAAAPQVAYQAAPQIAYAQQPQYYAAAPVQAAPAASYGTPAAGHAKGY
jgi:hypothetical protein